MMNQIVDKVIGSAINNAIDSATNDVIDRTLVGSEKNYWVANQFSTNNVISVIQGSGDISPDALTSALSTLQRIHPMLRVHIHADSNNENPRFLEEGTKNITLDHNTLSTPNIDDAILEETIRQQLNTSVITGSTPLCRVEFIEASNQWALIVCCSHIISDASSVMILAKDIVAFLAKSNPASKTVHSSTILIHPQRPPLEECFPKQYRGLRTLAMVLVSQFRLAIQQIRKKPSRLIPEQSIPYEDRLNGLLRRQIDPTTFAELKKICKIKDVSVHGILTAALTLSIAKELESKGQLNSRTLGIGSPVNFRNALDIDVEKELGTYICTLFSFVDIDLDEWTLAKEINHEIRYRYENKEHYASLNLLKWLAPNSKQQGKNLVDYIERKGPGNICISNIGVSPFNPTYGKLKIKSVEWFASLSITGYLLMSVNTTLDTCHLNYTYIDQIVSNTTACNIADRVDELLARIIKDQER